MGRRVKGGIPDFASLPERGPTCHCITSDPTTRKKNEKRIDIVRRSKWGVGGKHHKKIIEIFCRRLPTCEGHFPLPPLSYPLKYAEKTMRFPLISRARKTILCIVTNYAIDYACISGFWDNRNPTIPILGLPFLGCLLLLPRLTWLLALRKSHHLLRFLSLFSQGFAYQCRV